MKITLIVLVTLAWAIPTFSQICDETRSYNKTWALQSRFRESKREERKKYLETLTQDQKERISDYDLDPSYAMTCGMGFSSGLAKIFLEGKAGFINNKGQVVIKPHYRDVGRFSEGLAPAEFEDGKWGYISRDGKTIIHPRFDWALIFREGRALVQVGTKWGFIDKSGQLIINPLFAHANSFSEGMAMVQIWEIDSLYDNEITVLKTGYIGKSGRWLIKPILDGGKDFKNGKTIAKKHLVDKTNKKAYYGCVRINRIGREISKELDSCIMPSEGLALVDSGGPEIFFEDHKTGYKDRHGKIIWPPSK